MAADARKENKMTEDMTQAEIARDETEQKMLYKFLFMIREGKDKGESLDQLEERVKALITK